MCSHVLGMGVMFDFKGELFDIVTNVRSFNSFFLIHLF